MESESRDWNSKEKFAQQAPASPFSVREILKNFVAEVELVDERAKGLKRVPAEFLIGRGWRVKWKGDTLISDIYPLRGGHATIARLTHHGDLVLELPFIASIKEDEILALSVNFHTTIPLPGESTEGSNNAPR